MGKYSKHSLKQLGKTKVEYVLPNDIYNELPWKVIKLKPRTNSAQ